MMREYGYRGKDMLSDVQFRAIVENSPTMIRRAGIDARCDYFNATWLQFTGRTMQMEMGEGWLSGVHPQDANRVRDTFLAAFNKREPFEIEYRLKRYDGKYRWINDRGVPLVHLNTTFGGYVGSCIDVTERAGGNAIRKITSNLVRNQIALLRQKELLDGMLESLEFPFFSVDGQYLYTCFNSSHRKEMKTLFGVDIHKGMNILDCHAIPADRAKVKESLDSVMTGKSLVVRGEAGNDAENRKTYLIFHGPVLGKDGRVTGVSVFAQDITGQAKAQEEAENNDKRYRQLLEKEQKGYDRRRRSALMNDYLGKRIDEPVFGEMAKTMGLDFGKGPYWCSVLCFGDKTRSVATELENKKYCLIDNMQNDPDCVAWEIPAGIGLLCRMRENAKDPYAEIVSKVKALLGIWNERCQLDGARCGVSFTTEWTKSLQELFAQAMAAAEFGPVIRPGQQVVAWPDLGWVQFLVKDLQSCQTHQFVFEQLGPLLQMKRRESRTALLETLEIILTEESVEAVAKKMQIHPQTVRYRRRLMERMLGARVDSKEKATNMLIAVKILALQRQARSGY